MSNNNEYSINALPSKTWYWLNMNDTRLSWNSKVTGCEVKTEGFTGAFADKDNKDYADIENAVKTGATEGADAIFNAENVVVTVVNADKSANNKTIYVNIEDKNKAAEEVNQAGKLIVNAEDDVEFTIIETFKNTADVKGHTAFRTLIDAGKNSRVKLVQVFMQPKEHVILNDVGSRCADNAQFSIVQLFLGEGNLYDGIRTDLVGNNSEFNASIGYFGADKQNVDINLISNHIGKKTHCDIGVDGALKDSAKKVFRGTIDFRNGSSGSTGAETENVLLLGDDVENKTIPVILCAEEDVNGSHGASIGELDDETLFYFAARGIDARAAEDIMTRGRLEVVIRNIGDENIEELAKEQLLKVLEVGYES